ncbi:MAG: OpgC domain-containing protein [Hoeflea sp.]|uniref:OpgC family protein n=1 Tax=Hoeflea sp. TaxID=1940281 RepID=UPI001D875C7E|nr:OpgC domain-containing protein [Hoeflea sp.]MBU4527790.1 OpgC domain-containing protein [Alphaproteobacteria bacterium]MBU4546175.1 OpgC domain-containing protein [Alphaproteobacteria bacterium]MBU4553140.1 OpgC domain-containing protein [Alphaproteobacteria bacterium]MBV1724212.1 OpgC domain-containing protein [Hoeflea sp.]MBV1759897.1 OpgC domain-containing protein [Hoeflea sp.]
MGNDLKPNHLGKNVQTEDAADRKSAPAGARPKSRDTRIDALRAFCLITIFVNHVPGNPFEQLTSKNFGFSDAAEAFVLISGVSAAYAYGMKFEAGSRLLTAIRALRRAGVLYVAHLVCTLVTLAIFAGFSLYYAAPELLDTINIGPLIADPVRGLLGLVTLGHQLGYNNILSMYGVILLMLPLFLLLSHWGIAVMLAASGALWLGCGLFLIALPTYPGGNFWFLNPLSWQFLFVIGMAANMHVRGGGRIPVSVTLQVLCVLYLLLSLAWVKVPFWGVDVSLGLPAVLTGFDKTFLSVSRLTHVLAMAYLLVTVPALSNIWRVGRRNPLAVMGRHALPVFIAGTVLSMLAQAWNLTHASSATALGLMILAGVLAQAALAYYLEWLGGLQAAARRPVPNIQRVTAADPLRPAGAPEQGARPVTASPVRATS